MNSIESKTQHKITDLLADIETLTQEKQDLKDSNNILELKLKEITDKYNAIQKIIGEDNNEAKEK